MKNWSIACLLLGFVSGEAAFANLASRACYYAGTDGTKRICEGVAPPTVAYCGESRAQDCCDPTQAEWKARSSALYKKAPSGKSGVKLVVWECVKKPDATKPAYRPVDPRSPEKSAAFYRARDKLSASNPRFTLSALPADFIDTPGSVEPGPELPPGGAPTTGSGAASGTGAPAARADAALLSLDPLSEESAGAPLSASERQRLSKADQSCGYVDLREKGLPPLRHQQLTGWTFAYSAADLIEIATGPEVGKAAREQRLSGRAGSLSPRDLTMGYYQLARSTIKDADFQKHFRATKATPRPGRTETEKDVVGFSELSGGSTLGVLLAYKQRGGKACLEGASPSEAFAEVKCDGAAAETLEFRELLGCLDRMVTRLCNASLQGEALAQKKKEELQKNETVLKALFPGVSFTDFESTLGQAMSQSDPALAFIGTLNSKSCSRPVVLPALEFSGLSSSQSPSPSAGEFMKALNEQLSAQAPVSLGVRRDTFLNSALAAQESPGVAPEKWGAEGLAALAVGRRWNPSASRCEYLLRPNLGPECSAIYSTSVSCQSGYVWVDASTIQKSVKEVAYVKKGAP